MWVCSVNCDCGGPSRVCTVPYFVYTLSSWVSIDYTGSIPCKCSVLSIQLLTGFKFRPHHALCLLRNLNINFWSQVDFCSELFFRSNCLTLTALGLRVSTGPLADSPPARAWDSPGRAVFNRRRQWLDVKYKIETTWMKLTEIMIDDKLVKFISTRILLISQ